MLSQLLSNIHNPTDVRQQTRENHQHYYWSMDYALE